MFIEVYSSPLSNKPRTGVTKVGITRCSNLMVLPYFPPKLASFV